MQTTGLVQFKKAFVNLFDEGKSVIRTEYREQCFMYYSFQREESMFGDLLVKPFMTFLADNGQGVACEWEPTYGPFTKWNECSSDWEGKDWAGNEIKARKHWHFEFVQGDSGNWSQMAVDETGIKRLLLDHDIDGVFDVLMSWAK